MAQLIDKDKVIAEIDRRIHFFIEESENFPDYDIEIASLLGLKHFLETLETKDMDFEKLGEIARHLIAVKDHIEDIRLYKEEWLILEKIGYQE